jgi:phosphatidylinositol alpha-1,6-mannosyltransferase
VSKPLAAPWHDSGKNWARDIARYGGDGGRVTHHVLVPRGADDWEGVAGVVAEPVYGGLGQFAPRGLDNARALGRLLRGCPCELVHFCFAPNPRSNLIARLAMRRQPRPAVHTVLSVPARFGGIDKLLFAQQIVCVSRWTADQLARAGVRGQLQVIPASIPVEAPLRAQAPERVAAALARLAAGGRPLVVFPGDYEFSRAADVFADAIERLWRDVDADFVFACRIKRPPSLEREAALQRRLDAPLRAGRVHFLREVADMRALLAAAAAVALPSETTYAKMDLPLVVLEAMAEQTPVVLADVAPLREALGAARAGGLLVPPLRGDALADALRGLLRDPGAAARLGEQGRQHVLAHHDATQTCRRYADIYEAAQR